MFKDACGISCTAAYKGSVDLLLQSLLWTACVIKALFFFRSKGESGLNTYMVDLHREEKTWMNI
jgi:hypothetical protein